MFIINALTKAIFFSSNATLKPIFIRTSFKLFWILQVLTVFFVFAAFMGAQASSQKDLMQKAQNVADHSDSCISHFNRLWPLAKSGDQEARFRLLWSMMYDYTKWPASADRISRARIIGILAIHSLGYHVEDKEVMRQIEVDRAASLEFSGLIKPGDDEISNCLRGKQLEKCTAMALDQNIVPKFEDFAEQIDALIKAGYKITCSTHGE